jgi:hypothetical protein
MQGADVKHHQIKRLQWHGGIPCGYAMKYEALADEGGDRAFPLIPPCAGAMITKPLFGSYRIFLGATAAGAEAKTESPGALSIGIFVPS